MGARLRAPRGRGGRDARLRLRGSRRSEQRPHQSSAARRTRARLELMGRLPTWLVVGAIGAIGALAAADALRSTGGSERRAAPQPTVDDLTGTLLVANADCSVQALRLPDLTQDEPSRRPDCAGAVWSDDATLVAKCSGGVTAVHNQSRELVRRVGGCSPAWREDGSVGVLKRGSLVLARSVFRPVVLM